MFKKNVAAGETVAIEVAAGKVAASELAAGKAAVSEVAAGKAAAGEVAAGKAAAVEVATGKTAAGVEVVGDDEPLLLSNVSTYAAGSSSSLITAIVGICRRGCRRGST